MFAGVDYLKAKLNKLERQRLFTLRTSERKRISTRRNKNCREQIRGLDLAISRLSEKILEQERQERGEFTKAEVTDRFHRQVTVIKDLPGIPCRVRGWISKFSQQGSELVLLVELYHPSRSGSGIQLRTMRRQDYVGHFQELEKVSNSPRPAVFQGHMSQSFL